MLVNFLSSDYGLVSDLKSDFDLEEIFKKILTTLKRTTLNVPVSRTRSRLMPYNFELDGFTRTSIIAYYKLESGCVSFTIPVDAQAIAKVYEELVVSGIQSTERRLVSVDEVNPTRVVSLSTGYDTRGTSTFVPQQQKPKAQSARPRLF